MEIERKFLVNSLPPDISKYNYHMIEQAYLTVDPVVRVRRQDSDYYLTYKSKGLLSREEYNLPLNAESYQQLLIKSAGNIISKTRYLIPLENNLTAELDIFHNKFDSLVLVEVEFSSEDEALAFEPPYWFGTDVTYDPSYKNSALSCKIFL